MIFKGRVEPEEREPRIFALCVRPTLSQVIVQLDGCIPAAGESRRQSLAHREAVMLRVNLKIHHILQTFFIMKHGLRRRIAAMIKA
jgi:hypothetical protein